MLLAPDLLLECDEGEKVLLLLLFCEHGEVLFRNGKEIICYS